MQIRARYWKPAIRCEDAARSSSSSPCVHQPVNYVHKGWRANITLFHLDCIRVRQCLLATREALDGAMARARPCAAVQEDLARPFVHTRRFSRWHTLETTGHTMQTIDLELKDKPSTIHQAAPGIQLHFSGNSSIRADDEVSAYPYCRSVCLVCMRVHNKDTQIPYSLRSQSLLAECMSTAQAFR